MFGWRACRYPASKFHEEAGWVLSLTSRSCSSHAQPGRYECHELMSVSVWPRPQHGELSSTSRVGSSAFASRYTDATQLCVSGRYTCLCPSFVSRPHVSLNSTQAKMAGWL